MDVKEAGCGDMNCKNLDKDVVQLKDLTNSPSNYIFLRDSVVIVSLLGKY